MKLVSARKPNYDDIDKVDNMRDFTDSDCACIWHCDTRHNDLSWKRHHGKFYTPHCFNKVNMAFEKALIDEGRQACRQWNNCLESGMISAPGSRGCSSQTHWPCTVRPTHPLAVRHSNPILAVSACGCGDR